MNTNFVAEVEAEVAAERAAFTGRRFRSRITRTETYRSGEYDVTFTYDPRGFRVRLVEVARPESLMPMPHDRAQIPEGIFFSTIPLGSPHGEWAFAREDASAVAAAYMTAFPIDQI